MRILTGLQATGDLHLGNYLGAIKPLVDYQSQGETFFFIPNLHSLNIRPTAAALKEETYSNVAMMIAAGVGEDAAIYAQSQIPAHSELFGILNNYVTMGELARMTQYKDKQLRFGSAGQLVGLFEYPVLMAADILLYDADLVPVGADQKQHVELTRDIAERFNNLHGEVFNLPKPALPKVGARVMSLQNPDKKMSKSDADVNGKVLLSDSAEVIRAKFKKAVTDSGSEIELADAKPALANLIQIYASLAGIEPAAVVKQFGGQGYGQFKQALGEMAAKELSALQQRYREVRGDEAKLAQVLARGAAKARPLAEAKLEEVKQALGLL